MGDPRVSGAMMIDASHGLCLCCAGKAVEEDAAALVVASRNALDCNGVGAVRVRGDRVLLHGGSGILVAVWKET